MPEIAGLRAGDPAEVAEYRLTGRLADEVFVGQSRAGERVVVRLMPSEMEPEPFLRAMEPLRSMSAVGTAQILTAGVSGERAYLVTEFVDGPALQESGGSFDEVGLYRLAVGTITALVAVHQAGLVHGDIRPGNVLLGPDGPRVIDAGLEQAMAEASVATRKVAVPAYTAPERLRGADAGPAADVFSWAATMVFAVLGASPFDGGSMSATVERILNGRPDLPDLGELHELIVQCLNKDPAARPAANEVLLRLVGQSTFLTGRVPIAGEPPARDTGPSPADGRDTGRSGRRFGVMALAASFVVGALVSGAGVYAVSGSRPSTGTVAATTSASPSASTAPTITSSQAIAPLLKVEKKAATDTKLPETGVTMHEHPKDPVRVSAYMAGSDKYTAFARDSGGTFKAVGAAEQPLLSPRGDWVALNPMLKFQTSELDQVKFVSMSTSESFVVSTVKKPLQSMTPVWSRDGGKLLLSVYDRTAKPERLVGFVVVDVAARKAVHVETEYTSGSNLTFAFAPDGSVVRGYWDGKVSGIEFYDMSGQVIKTMHWVGMPIGNDWFSPSGNRFATRCPNEKEICVWDVKTGARLATMPSDMKGSFLGWFNEQHFIMQDPGKKKDTEVIKIVDYLGATKRVLGDVVKDRALMQFAPVPAS
ncbi:WD40 repeat domain-containing serine/threonine protein kinase [Nonomuraea sp. NPDC050404]|uniref:WD40 repeat domain-containing serine/threonine protein kinase n=1 Tax=Nonomuraea sp. NPDC050404 TaxID=3155783 RepID=UPI0033D31116